MNEDTPDNWTAAEILLIALAEELEAAVEMSTRREAEALFAKIAKRCRKAMILAEAGHLVAAGRS